MDLNSALDSKAIALNVRSTDKWGVIEELLGLLVDAGKVKDREAALEALVTREKKLPTGMGKGIAIPHAKTAAVREVSAAIGISGEGIDFEGSDSEPCRIIILNLSPEESTTAHMKFLAEISRRLSQEDCRERMLQAGTPEEILSILS